MRLIAENIGALSFVLYEGADERDNHPLLNLMRRPNPRQDCASLLEAIASHLLLAGNAYIEAVGLGEESQMRVRELYALRPDRIRLLPGPDGWRRPTNIRRQGRRYASIRMPRCRRYSTLRCSIRSMTITGKAHWKPPLSRSTPTTPRHAGTRRCSTTPRVHPVRWFMPEPSAVDCAIRGS